MLATVFPDQQQRDTARSIMARVAEGGALVPPIWHTEVANALVTRHRRGLIELAEITLILEGIAKLPIAPDGRTSGEVQASAGSLAISHKMTGYDATYLELARSSDLPLATFDRALRRAAEAEGVPLAPTLE